MPDAIGFWLSAAVLVMAFTIFGIVGRLVDGVITEIRLTVAPAMVAGVRAWGEPWFEARADARANGAGTTAFPDPVLASPATGDAVGAQGSSGSWPGVEVPLQRVRPRGRGRAQR